MTVIKQYCECGEPDTCTSGLPHVTKYDFVSAYPRLRPEPGELIEVKFTRISEGRPAEPVWRKGRATWISQNSFKWALTEFSGDEDEIEGETLHADQGMTWRFIS